MRALAILAAAGLGAACGGGAVVDERAESPPADDEPLASAPAGDDPYLWLEEVMGAEAIAWVREQGEATQKRLDGHPLLSPLHARIREAYRASEPIATPQRLGDSIYEFHRGWRGASPARGTWRRASIESYRAGEPAWEELLDLDGLAQVDDEDWLWRRADCLPDGDRCLIALSIGGADALVYREFDVERRAFVEEEGFELPPSRSRISWWDRDTLLVASALGGAADDPRTLALWRRGTELEEAEVIFEGEEDDFFLRGYRWRDGAMVLQMPDAYSRVYYFIRDGEQTRLPLPEDADLTGRLARYSLVKLHSDWEQDGVVIERGSLAAVSAPDLFGHAPNLEPVFQPGPRQSLGEVTSLGSAAILTVLDDATSRLVAIERGEDGFAKRRLDAPEGGTIHLVSADEETGRLLYVHQSFLAPPALYEADVASDRHERIAGGTPAFDADSMAVTRLAATSSDGTRIPYFVVAPKGGGADTPRPTLLTAYGGFRVARTPTYLREAGPLWLERGGVYVLANIRGGGEFGPDWHDAARRRHRQHAFDDFIAVAEDLIARGITTPEMLGIRGGSNGGLLVGAALTQRPELFGAAIADVPLFDMRRYHQLYAGALYVAEYGDPDDPDEWEFLRAYSPYHNLDPDADYPPLFITTANNDDRVHPGHGRKMAARMLDQGHDVLYYEAARGGHRGANMTAVRFTFLHATLNPDAAAMAPRPAGGDVSRAPGRPEGVTLSGGKRPEVNAFCASMTKQERARVRSYRSGA